ncbi:MAG: replicative DNA helicase [Bacilli bacterium]|nr:replicative DNA helicase [Bacilli bacterium]
MKDKKIPQNIEAEQAVLASMFLSKYALEKAVDELSRDLFYLDNHGIIFDVLKELHESNRAIDVTTLTDELEKKDLLSKIGGVEYLGEIINSIASPANIDDYISIVNEKAIRRRLIETSLEIEKAAYESDDTLNDLLDNSEKKMLNVVRTRKGTEFRSIQDVITKAQSNLEQLSELGGNITGLITGFDEIDNLTSGLHSSELIIIAARPAMGKTAFALNLATNVAIKNNKTVAIFNMEMPAEQLANRMFAAEGQIEGYKLSTGNLLKSDWSKLDEAISRLSDAKIFIDDTPGMTISEIKAKCRRLASQSGDLGLIVIDYLQLIQGSAKYAGNRQQEIAEISRSLKTLAMELSIPIVALAQLSRSVEAREDKRPLLSDLRESGSIEQDADIVAFLYRDDYYTKKVDYEDGSSKSEFIVAKHRNGATKTIPLLFRKNISKFESFLEENGEL